jgi:hypothetical protein
MLRTLSVYAIVLPSKSQKWEKAAAMNHPWQQQKLTSDSEVNHT